MLEELKKNEYTLLASNGYYSKLDGIKPVIFKMREDINYFKDLIVADKIIGKASAMLFALSGVKEVYTCVLSISGKQIFEKYNVKYHYEQLVDNIINRLGNDICPMEKTVKDIDDLNLAYNALNDKVN